MEENKKILIVEDDRSQLSLAKVIIKGLYPHAIIDEAWSGMAAIKKMESKPCDIILCDMILPDIMGDKILEFVRGHDKLKDIPFVIMTSSTDKQFIVKAAQLGVTGYIIKPLTADKLSAKLKNILSD
jgi:two-component system chemotaxis response regulator CheY